MTHFTSISQKIINTLAENRSNLSISGPSVEQWLFFLSQSEKQLSREKPLQIFITGTQTEAENCYASLKKLLPQNTILFYPGLELSPYSGYLHSEKNLFSRFHSLAELSSSNTNPIYLVLPLEAFILKTPPKSFFENPLVIKEEDILAPNDLAERLVSLGYRNSFTVEEPGTFVKKGEILDLYPIGGDPVRLVYFDELIEHIYSIDKTTLRTNKSNKIQALSVFPSVGIFSQKPHTLHLRENLPQVGPNQRDRYRCRKEILDKVTHGQLFDSYPAYTSLFFQEAKTILDYFSKEKTLIHIMNMDSIERELETLKDQLYGQYDIIEREPDSTCPLPAPDKIYQWDLTSYLRNYHTLQYAPVDFSLFHNELNEVLQIKTESFQVWLSKRSIARTSKYDFLKSTFEALNDFSRDHGKILFFYQHESAKKEISHLIDDYFSTDTAKPVLQKVHLTEGFYYQMENTLIITESDLFKAKKVKTKKQKPVATDLFAEQLANIKPGDFVIHADHGVGIYQGMETMELADKKNDFIVLLYDKNDKVYVPVYKVNLLQKHAESHAAIKPNNLRTNKFSQSKERAKSAAKKLAFNLLQVEARRKTASAFAFSEPDHHFREFELEFPFQETPDQIEAIEQTVKDMMKPTPMDRLVCGDVGFGKTEVAMRAAFKAVLDQKQVAILVPTTILALQHYHSFLERFKNFPVNIELLCRFRTPKESQQVKQDLFTGKADIVIGTHMLLSKTVGYKDLGLVIVDEEHRFGVTHKEKLKLLKSSVDFLTLTATPIPRTLQLSFMGLKDLSLIQTPPPKRQSIKSYVLKHDKNSIRDAIIQEIARGGQIFYIHNRVQDMERIKRELTELVPDVSVVMAHGQMSERELEKKITDFYEGKYQILLSTTIVESGIDIPNANTLIINRADCFGLAQLHQLRGRIGRSDRKAYAYFLVPNDKMLTPQAEQRLKALQTFTDMGAGFALASTDLEIRGAGDIIGGEQSGHIDAIGLELYMELLKEAIYELRGEKQLLVKNIEINAPFPSYLPDHYISDSPSRLKLYKQLSNSETLEQLESFQEYLIDLYGPLPEEANNLVHLLMARLHLMNLGIYSVDLTGTSVILKFSSKLLEQNNQLRDQIIQSFISRPKTYQFTPDYKLIYRSKTNLNAESFFHFSKDIAEQLQLC